MTDFSCAFVDKPGQTGYNKQEYGQFETILSLNKTMERDGRTWCVLFYAMNKKIKNLIYGAMIAALYAVLTHLQNFLFPGSANLAIQFRLSEILCVLAFFTPSAVWGLTVGCLIYNLTYSVALPLDFLVGTLATFLAAGGMYLTRRWTVKGYPLLGMLLPAVTNAFLVGWELTVYIGGGFWVNALCVAIGEAAVLLIPGSILYCTVKARGLDRRIFS